MRTFKTLAALIILLAAITNLQAQSDRIRIILHQPPPNMLGVGDMWNLTLENTTKNDLKIYLSGTATEEKEGLIIEGKSKVFTVKPGKTNYKYNDFSGAELKYNNGKYKEVILRTGNAPEGSYTICVTAFEESGEIAGMENCITQTVQQLGSITLISPEDGVELTKDQPVTFVWTPLPGAKDYTLKIVEIKGDQSPETAMKTGKPIIEKEGLKMPTIQIPNIAIDDNEVRKNKKFAWMVKSGEVESGVYTFGIGTNDTSGTPPNAELFDNVLCVSTIDGDLEELTFTLLADIKTKYSIALVSPKPGKGSGTDAGPILIIFSGENNPLNLSAITGVDVELEDPPEYTVGFKGNTGEAGVLQLGDIKEGNHRLIVTAIDKKAYIINLKAVKTADENITSSVALCELNTKITKQVLYAYYKLPHQKLKRPILTLPDGIVVNNGDDYGMILGDVGVGKLFTTGGLGGVDVGLGKPPPGVHWIKTNDNGIFTFDPTEGEGEYSIYIKTKTGILSEKILLLLKPPPPAVYFLSKGESKFQNWGAVEIILGNTALLLHPCCTNGEGPCCTQPGK